MPFRSGTQVPSDPEHRAWKGRGGGLARADERALRRREGAGRLPSVWLRPHHGRLVRAGRGGLHAPA